MADAAFCPSFRTIIVASDPTADAKIDNSYPTVHDDFEFAIQNSASPIYPVFGRIHRITPKENSDSESEFEEGEDPPSEASVTMEEEKGSYCLGEPPPKSPDPMRKSRSMGSTGGEVISSALSCGWRLVFGRSRSVGKDRFLPSPPSPPPSSKKKVGREETEVAAAYRRFYGGVGSGSEKRRRGSFSAEAYRKDSVGFLPSLKGIGRSFRGF